MLNTSYSIESIPSKYIVPFSSCTIAICLAKNNPLLDKNSSETVTQILRELSEKHNIVHILVADEINVFERMISNGTTKKQAIKMADADGAKIAQQYHEIAERLELPNVKVMRWQDIQNEQYWERVTEFRQLVSNDENLAKILRDTATFYIKRRNPFVTIN
ncbi:MAG: hypothetical protein EOP45_15755, partial [Sphingobacteriaceae bacterium]